MADAVNILFGTPNIDPIKASILGLIPIFDRVARAGKTTIENSAKDQTRAETEASRQIVREATAAAREKDRLAKQSVKEAERTAKDELRIRNAVNALEVRDWQQKEREKERFARQSASERERIAREELRIRNAINNLEVRDWQRKERERVKTADGLLERRSRSFGGGAGAATGRIMGMAGRVAGIAAGLGGGFAVADAMRAGIAEERQAGVIFRGATNVGDFKSQKDVQKLASQTAISVGGTTEDIQGGLDAFVRKTGDLGVTKQLLGPLAKLAAATGTNFSDMGNTAAEVQNQVGDAAQTMEVMRALAGQGRAGAIDIKDLGQYGGRLAASAAQFTGGLSGNIESFGAIAQLAKKLGGATDTAEATESVARLSSDFSKHETGFKAIGVNVFADKSRTKFRNAEDVITESVVKSKGDLTVLKELFGERSIRAAIGAQVAYTNAGGGTAGEAAIRGQFAALKATSMTEEEVDKGNTEQLQENVAKINNATTQFRLAINEHLLPILPRVIDQFAKLIPVLERGLDYLATNPWKSAVLLIGAALVAEIGKAAISGAVSGAFTKLAEFALRQVGGGAGAPGMHGLPTPAPVTAGGASVGVLGTVAAALAITATAVTITAAGVSIIDKAFDQKNAADSSVRSALIEGGNAEGALRAGVDGSREAAQREVVRLAGLDAGAGRASGDTTDSMLSAALALVPGVGFAGGVANAAGKAISPYGGLANTFEGAANYVTAGGVGRSYAQIANDEAAARASGAVKEQLESLQAALRQTTPALDNFTASLKDSSPKSDPGSGWPNGGAP